MDWKERLLNGSRAWVEVHLPGTQEALCLWALDTETFFATTQSATAANGELDTTRLAAIRVMACLRDAPPPTGQPVLGDWRQHNEWVTVVKQMPIAWLLQLGGKVTELSGLSDQEPALSFTAPGQADLSGT